MPDENFKVYAEASKAFEYGLHDVADKLATLLKTEAWRYYVTPTGEVKEPKSFVEFVTSDPLDGLGTDVDTLRRVCSGTPYALDLLDGALQRPYGGDRRSEAAKNKIDNVKLDPPTGNASAQALRRLRRDRPDLHEKVIAEELSAHAAMIQAGFRHATATVRLDDPARAAATLRKRLTTQQRHRLARLLLEDA